MTMLQKKAAQRLGVTPLHVVRDDTPTERVKRQPEKPKANPSPSWMVLILVALIGAALGIGAVFAWWRLHQ